MGHDLKGKVIVLRRSILVKQRDLEELILLTRILYESRQAWRAKRMAIRRAIEAGAEVEEGIHTAAFKEFPRRGTMLKRLVVR